MYYITCGDLNVSLTDRSRRATVLTNFISDFEYKDTDLKFYSPSACPHKSRCLIDRILTSKNLLPLISNVCVNHSFHNSDHFPISMHVTVEGRDHSIPSTTKVQLDWKRSSEKAILYQRLSEKKCHSSLRDFRRSSIDGPTLYTRTITNLQEAASTCIPKRKQGAERRRHNIPQWRERIANYRHNVNYWLSVQLLNGGPNGCHPTIRHCVRAAKSQYKRNIRTLRHEISQNVADHVTSKNCYKFLFRKFEKST